MLTTAHLSAKLVAYLDLIASIDLFDYLGDYAPEHEPRDEAGRAHDAMRAAVEADILRTGEAVFWERMAMREDDEASAGAALVALRHRETAEHFRQRAAAESNPLHLRMAARFEAMAEAVFQSDELDSWEGSQAQSLINAIQRAAT